MGTWNRYHAFLSYPTKLAEQARQIYEYLSGSGLEIFFAEEDLHLGNWTPQLDEAVETSAALLLVVGPNGLGPWEKYELRAYMTRGIEEALVVPLLLDGAQPDAPNAPAAVRLSQSFAIQTPIREHPGAFQKLIGFLSDLDAGDRNWEVPLGATRASNLVRRSVSFYHSHATQFYEEWRERLPLEPINEFAQLVPKGSLILDAGCGPGHHSDWFSRQGYQTMGLDLADGQIELARKLFPKLRFDLGDMRRMRSTKTSSIDAIWASGSCVHTPRELMTQQLWEFLRVLKPGGVLGFSVHIEKPAEIKADGRFFERYKSVDELTRILEWVGFEVSGVREEVTTDNTLGQKRIKKWAAVRAKVPASKVLFS